MGNAGGAGRRVGSAVERARTRSRRRRPLAGAAALVVVVLGAAGVASSAGAPSGPATPPAPVEAPAPTDAVATGHEVAPAATAPTSAPSAVDPAAPGTTITLADDEGGESPGDDPMPPLVQVTAGVGSAGVTIGTRCLGMTYEGGVVGCPPALRPDLTLDVDTLLLPGL